MQVFQGSGSLKNSFFCPVVAIGNFDGIHLGHQKIIQMMHQEVLRIHGESVVYTFSPHPRSILYPKDTLMVLTTSTEKKELIEGLRVSYLLEEVFDENFSKMSPKDFFYEILIKKIGAHAIVVGDNFCFGKQRQGDLNFLSTICNTSGVQLIIAEPVYLQGDLISSSNIRQSLLKGQIEHANAMLGRNFSYRGSVVPGIGRGRRLGFPTANLDYEKKILLPSGVYLTQTLFQGTFYPGVTNIGKRPTFHTAHLNCLVCIENHLINQKIDLYGQTLEVQFLKKIRDENKFDHSQDLIAQIKKDIKIAEDYFFI